MNTQRPEAVAQAAKLRLNVLAGLPDDRLCEISLRHDGRGFAVIFPGTADLVQFLPPRLFALNTILLGPRGSLPLATLGPGPILNHIAEPDRCAEALKMAAEMVARSGRACFNHPSAVQATRRDEVAQTLSGIEGLHVPRAVRFVHSGEETSRQLLGESGLRYPLVVRIAGDHGGVSTLKIDGADSLDRIDGLNCRGRNVYAAEFVDFASADGKYRKYRIAVVGSEILLRHMIVGDGWLLHAGRRIPDSGAEEARVLVDFENRFAPKVSPLVIEIAQRLDLDYFGIDCTIAEEGRMLIFEANACMNILLNSQPSPNIWDKPIARIKRALFAVLRSPRKWRYPPKA